MKVFIDTSVQHPNRFVVRNSQTGEILSVHVSMKSAQTSAGYLDFDYTVSDSAKELESGHVS